MSPRTTTIQAIREIIKKELAPLYPEREIESITDILCRHRLDLRRHELGLRKHEILMPPDAEWFMEALSRLRQNVPVQYVTGDTEFYGLHMKVSPAALIPRPETEELVNWILDEHTGERCRILDIGTGSGCIALALSQGLPGAPIYGTDVSEEAICLAGDNARSLGLHVDFLLHDISTEVPPEGLGSIDLIVSNPPYIPDSERDAMHDNVLEHEPGSALFVPDDDPLRFYRHIAITGNQLLRSGGLLYLEIHENFGQPVSALLEKQGYAEIKLRQDINGKDRMVRAVRP